jgi:hypothetical protein
MNSEVWKDVKDYEGLYQVSNFGRVKSLKREWSTNKNKRCHDDIIMKICNLSRGYQGVPLCKDGKTKTFKVHRLVAIAFIDNPLDKPQINHIDCDKKNNHFSNLEWVTNSENLEHAIENNLRNCARGEKQHLSKLTEKDVKDILNSSLSTVKLGKIYNMDHTTIGDVKSKRTWRHVE